MTTLAPVFAVEPVEISNKGRWVGRILSGIALSFLAFDTVLHLLAVAPAVKGSEELGYAASVLVPLGIVELVCWVLYVIPRTALLGAVLWTGYLGGAVATHVRVDNPLFSHVLFPVYVGAMLWFGLGLRDKRLQAMAPRVAAMPSWAVRCRSAKRSARSMSGKLVVTKSG